MQFTNSSSLYNLNKVTFSSVHFNSSSQFENQSGATASINGEFYLDNTTPFNNNGSLIAKTLKTTSGATINNNCNMHITESGSSLEQANINIDGGCYIYMKGLAGLNNSNFKLGAKALMVIDSPLKFNGGNNTLTGLSTGERALFFVNGDMNAGNYGILKCSGNVDRASTKDLDATQTGGSDAASGSVDFTNVKLGAENGCSREFTTNGGGTPSEETPQLYTFAFEDMFREAGDYDFNDVVVKVSAPEDGKVTVTLAAAGASKNLKVYYKLNKGKETELFDGKEVHEALGVDAGVCVNTGSTSAPAINDYIEVSQGYSISQLDIYIKEVGKSNEIHIPAHTSSFVAGNAPYAILVPVDWAYPAEQQRVTSKYTKFADWAQDATKSMDWYSE